MKSFGEHHLYSGLTHLFGRTGARLLVVLAIAAAGTALTATVGAALAVIPFLDFLIAMPLSVFPTLLIYVAAAAAIYLPLIVLLARGRVLAGKLQVLILVGAVLAVVLVGVLVPLYWNRAAGVGAPAETGWEPLEASYRGPIALLSQGQFSPADEICDSFCLALLVTQRAGEVIVARTQSMPDSYPIDARSIRLRTDWRACFSKLPDYSMVIRSYPDQRLDGFHRGLDPYFADELEQCLVAKPAKLDVTRQVSLINWHDPTRVQTGGGKAVGLEPVAGEQRIGGPGRRKDNVRYLRWGRRYEVPALLWPYAGNAGSGGRFKLSWATSLFSTLPGGVQPDEAWWTMVAGGEQLAKEAVPILDAVVSDARR
ncbi:MAG: hypothetical protein AVDCRST_MAG91-2730 [uncultured Sphingomonadaceae bacterium]|uniref:Uncharacterized protein n=1 Tax=uncultured Sphingomonadaceae bacterium TaxID=169976 RepID=A0A6J4TPT6_9SPHN|nr:MAG: hypothetical protein AVDCRST_MAG91-2730 [uncultured Sphingomonadaceae bacterium]